MIIINYNNINSFFINDKILFFDIFIRNNELIIISPEYHYYKNINFDNMIVKYNNNIIEKFIYYKMHTNEKINIFIYKFNYIEKIVNIVVEYNEHIKEFILFNNNIGKIYNIVQTTLCKDDYMLIDIYYNYYKNKGIEYFYIYYNNKLNKDIIDKYKNKENLILIEWNFEYWECGVEACHIAQTGQINHALYKYGKVISEYIIYNDFDEYFYLDRFKNFNELINNYKEYEYLLFKNYWCKTIDDKIFNDFPNEIYKCIIPETQFRTKTLTKTEIVDIMGVHCPLKVNDLYKNIFFDNLIMLHFYNWSNKVRNIPNIFEKMIINN
jgi:hypothetical protein